MDIDNYVARMEEIVEKNLRIYTDMRTQLTRFKGLLKEEEEASKNVRGTFYYWRPICLSNFKPITLL